MMKDKTAISFQQKAFGTNIHSFRTIFDTPLIPALFKQTPVDIAFQCVADSSAIVSEAASSSGQCLTIRAFRQFI